MRIVLSDARSRFLVRSARRRRWPDGAPRAPLQPPAIPCGGKRSPWAWRGTQCLPELPPPIPNRHLDIVRRNQQTPALTLSPLAAANGYEDRGWVGPLTLTVRGRRSARFGGETSRSRRARCDRLAWRLRRRRAKIIGADYPGAELRRGRGAAGRCRFVLPEVPRRQRYPGAVFGGGCGHRGRFRRASWSSGCCRRATTCGQR